MKRSYVALATCALSLFLSSSARGEEVVGSIQWQDLAAKRALTSGTLVAASDGMVGSSLRVVHTGNGPATFPLVTIEQPGIHAARYALRGRVRYEAVAADSYLEMWNHLPDGAFFSRTMAESGPMRSLEGSSGWRTFVIPFVNREGGAPPQKLVFNLVMAGGGTVEIGPVDLVQFGPNENLLADSTPWWSDRQAGVLGGLAGTALGILGAIIGWCVSTGRAKGLVLGALGGLAWLGLGALGCGVVAAVLGQPYAVYYPLLLLGGLSTTVGFLLPRTLGKRYEERELRRMQALDA